MSAFRNGVRGFGWIVTAALLQGGAALAAPYWVAWEGNDYPENEGWTREGEGTRPARSLGGGSMTLDSLASEESEDFYRIFGIADPEKGEEFVMQWRVRIDVVDWDNPIFPFDPGVFVYSADGWQAGFTFGEARFVHFEEQVELSYSSHVFHAWEFRTTDMRTFTLKLDGDIVHAGSFVPSGASGRVSWGDLVSQTTSRASWDYFRFGVIPEPWSLTGLVIGMLHLIRRTQ